MEAAPAKVEEVNKETVKSLNTEDPKIDQVVSPKVEEPIQISMKVVEDLPKEEATVTHEPVVKKKKEVDAKDKASEHDTTEMKIEGEVAKDTNSVVASPKEQVKV